MSTTESPHKELILTLHEIRAVKFGSFQLKSGITSPIYLDLRQIVSYPSLLKDVAEFIHSKLEHLPFDLICGVPYTALPIATAFSIMYNKPMLMRRKEVKEYGTKKMIEGAFLEGQSCVVIEDLITSGGSVMETIDELRKVGLVVTDAVALIDREQGGAANLIKEGINIHTLFPITELMSALEEEGVISEEVARSTAEFIRNNQVKK